MTFPYNLGKAKVSDLNLTNASGTDASDEFTLVGFVLVFRGSRLRVPCWDKWSGVEKNVLWFDVSAFYVSAEKEDLIRALTYAPRPWTRASIPKPWLLER